MEDDVTAEEIDIVYGWSDVPEHELPDWWREPKTGKDYILCWTLWYARRRQPLPELVYEHTSGRILGFTLRPFGQKA